MRRMIKRRLKGLTVGDRVRVLHEALNELPGYYSGPYGELRRWIWSQIEAASTQRGAEHHDAYFLAHQGAAQLALVGPPNAGKSSLLRALTGRDVAIGNYPFTTLRPQEGMLVLHGAALQLIDLPGLLEDAAAGRGDGRAVLAAMRTADALLLVVPVSRAGLAQLRVIRGLVQEAMGFPRQLVVGSKKDLADTAQLTRFQTEMGLEPYVCCSSETDEGLPELKSAIWNLVGLVRVYPKPRGKPPADEPVVLRPGSTVNDFVAVIHRDWVALLQHARVFGPSARFQGQLVGRGHVLADGDAVELTVRARS